MIITLVSLLELLAPLVHTAQAINVLLVMLDVNLVLEEPLKTVTLMEQTIVQLGSSRLLDLRMLPEAHSLALIHAHQDNS